MVADSAITDLTTWRTAGTYFEVCNCDAICPCRRVGGRQGGRSTHGICMGALSWEVDRGGTDDISLEGLRTVVATGNAGLASTR